MHEIKNNLNLSSCQQEYKTNWRYPRIARAKKRKKLRNKMNFERWASHAFGPEVIGIAALKHAVEKLTNGQKKVFQYFLYFRSQGLPIFMAQQHIAERLGYGRQFISDTCQLLYDLGFISIYNRGSHAGNNISNVYRVASIFMKKHIWEDLMSLLPIMYGFWLCVVGIKGVESPFPHEFFWASKSWKPNKATLLINRDNNITNSSIKKDTFSDETIQEMKVYLSQLIQKDTFSRHSYPEKEKIDQSRRIIVYETEKPNFDSELQSKHRQLLRYREAKKVQSTLEIQLAKRDAEKGSLKEAQNNAKAAENLRRLFG